MSTWMNEKKRKRKNSDHVWISTSKDKKSHGVDHKEIIHQDQIRSRMTDTSSCECNSQEKLSWHRKLCGIDAAGKVFQDNL